jgi:hypothetical protein
MNCRGGGKAEKNFLERGNLEARKPGEWKMDSRFDWFRLERCYLIKAE